MDDVLKVVKEVLADVLKIPVEKILDDLDIVACYGMDSFKVINMLALLDERLDVELPDTDLPQIRTPRDLAKLVKKCLDSKEEDLVS